MKIDGGCHCGNITYEAEVDPDQVAICHCTDCQTLSGSAYRTYVPASAETFRFLAGEPKTYIKTGESGAKRVQTFCPECGSPIYSTSVGEGPKVYGIRLGTVRQRDELVPKKQIWSRSAQHWVMDLRSVERIEKQ
ncbi:MAG: GFA family protein [Kiloniellales bacterium]|jgi:hypothetical protein